MEELKRPVGRWSRPTGSVAQAGRLKGRVWVPRESGQLDPCSAEQDLLSNIGTQQPHAMAVIGT